MALDSSLFGGGNKPTESEATIKRNVDNPFSLTALLQGKAAGAAASAAPALDTSSTIRKWAKEPLQVDAGSFSTIKYFIDQKTGSDTTHITLWVDETTGAMVKEQVDSDKPPDLGNSLPIPPGVQLGKTSTTLILKSQATPGPTQSASPKASADPNASGAASPSPKASADPNASGAASPSPSPTPTPTATPTATPTPAA
jgi:cell division septation protein DedD